MHISHMLGASVLLAALGWSFLPTPSRTSDASLAPATPTPPPPPPPPPLANGHHALVVDGDRDQLTIVAASYKADPWAGVPKGLQSAWSLRIVDGAGALLAEVPVDLVHFDTSEARKGGGVHVQGCSVRDARITMLMNAPHFPTAATYLFTRRDAAGVVVVGEVEAMRVRQLAGGGR